MLRSTKDLEHYAIGAIDGHIGHVRDFYFDDDAWVVRYLVVDTGPWLSGRKVLISPISVRESIASERTLLVTLTREQVRNSPDVDTDKPVSSQYELEHVGYYGYQNYWGGRGMWGAGMYPFALAPDFAGHGLDRARRAREEEAYARAEQARHRNDDPHLRSCKEVVGYRIHAIDGEIGHVEGLLLDDETWAIRFVVVNTSNWWLGHKVLIAPQWITDVRWPDEIVSVDLTRESVRAAPSYDSTAELNLQQESSLYEHYGRTAYWIDAAVLERET